MQTKDNGLIYGPDDNVPTLEAGLLGLQHVLAMDVYVPPLIIAGLLSMGAAQKNRIFTSCIFSLWNRHVNPNRTFDENANVSGTFLCTSWCSSWRLFG